MKLTVASTDENPCHVQCEGDITQADLLTGGNPLVQVLGPLAFTRHVLLSLQKASFIDSAGIGWLVMCHKGFRDNGGKLVLHSIPPMIDHVFKLLHLSTVLHLAADEQAARSLMQGNQP